MSFELVVKNGKTFALVPVTEYEDALAEMELHDDLRTFAAAKARLDAGEDEAIPLSIVTRRLSGENPVKIWREYRQITQEQLAQTSGVSRGMIGGIEAGHKQAGVATLKKLATALKCDFGNLA
ncbi:helix-turn-helix domain-containing protein [Asticcacaulis benevestitus]|uniref:HTH cro/C1-type domain-containing protein n=1 Tax=Asticcacaulis benevestitus DSM 16100 = ATCC BAA-896 TaxID=1121022 RepID=V4PCG4_9CAUL|nr:helix-turn-helix transcriptional regulator [Asticcacaulis benevestitus]ESQ82990.1 hypothetical protein ABENE_20490 [Asticcacaulis benevestitus DSM 16100 = ATCC BAA-896]